MITLEDDNDTSLIRDDNDEKEIDNNDDDVNDNDDVGDDDDDMNDNDDYPLLLIIWQLYDDEEERTIDLEGEDLMPEAEFCIFWILKYSKTFQNILVPSDLSMTDCSCSVLLHLPKTECICLKSIGAPPRLQAMSLH